MNNSEIKKEYLHRIHKVQDYIELHLNEALSLEELSNIAGFSKFHFHRIFKGLIQETLSQYVNRLKIEKATNLLVHRLDMSITDIAYYFGFSDSAVFSRSFKNYYKISPIEYRNQYSKNCKEPYKISQYNEEVVKNNCKNKENFKSSKNLIRGKIKGEITIRDIQNMKVIYNRYIGEYKNLEDFSKIMMGRLLEYLSEQKLIDMDKSKVLSIYHDNPEFTKQKQLRTSLCITVPYDSYIEENNDIGSMVISDGKYIVGYFEIFREQYSDAWDYMYEQWLTNSQYRLRDSYPFEIYLNDPTKHPENKHFVEIYLPIEPI